MAVTKYSLDLFNANFSILFKRVTMNSAKKYGLLKLCDLQKFTGLKIATKSGNASRGAARRTAKFGVESASPRAPAVVAPFRPVCPPRLCQSFVIVISTAIFGSIGYDGCTDSDRARVLVGTGGTGEKHIVRANERARARVRIERKRVLARTLARLSDGPAFSRARLAEAHLTASAAAVGRASYRPRSLALVWSSHALRVNRSR